MKKIGLFIAALICSFSLLSQGVAINADGGNADGSAMLDVQSTESGVLIPRMTEAERDAIVSPATGLMIYQTDNTPGFYFNSGTDISPVWDRLIVGDDALDGSGAATRLAFWDSPSTLSSDAGLYWDNTNKRLGVGTTTPATNTSLHVEQSASDNGAVVFVGSYGGGGIDPPPCGGPTMLWYPDKAAFRAGRVETASFWSNANIGSYSFSGGLENIASGTGATAFGYLTNASGNYSFSVGYAPVSSGAYSFSSGYETLASGYAAICMGYNSESISSQAIAIGQGVHSTGFNSLAIGGSTTASGQGAVAIGTGLLSTGDYSTAIGDKCQASGNNSIAIGKGAESLSYCEFSVGSYNTLSTPANTSTWNVNDRLFVIGNGTSDLARSDALVILKNGNTGIGTSTPSTQFHTTGGVRFANYTNGFLSVDASGNLGVSSSSSLFTAGNGLSWSGSALNSVWTQIGNDIFNNNTSSVGIGTSSPSRKLEISGTGEQFVRVSSVNHDICGFEWFRSDPGYYDWRVYNNGGNLRFAYSADDLATVTDLVTFRSSGNVGIGTTAPSYQLHLSTNSAAKPTSSAWTVASDERLKTNIREYTTGLDSLMMIEPVWFTYNGKAGMPEETGVGVIAQDLQKVAPYMITEWTYTDENGSETEYLGVDNGAMTYMLINSVQEQQQIIEELLKQNEDLKRRIEKLEQE